MEELFGDELYDYMRKKPNHLKESEICRIFSQMLNPIFYLHSLNIIHCKHFCIYIYIYK